MGTRALSVLLLAVPGVALGQTAGTLTALPVDVGRDTCSTVSTANVGLTWTGTTSPVALQTWRLAVYADTDTCPTTAPTKSASNVLLAADQDAVAGNATASAAVSSGVIASKGGVTCVANPGPGAADVAKRICVWLVTNPGGAESSTMSAQGLFTFQLARPPAPVLDSVAPANAALIAYFHAGTASGLDTASSASYQVRAYLGTTLVSTASGSGSGIRVEGLVNTPPTTYDVKVVALSPDQNQSVESNLIQGTPLPFEDFWTAYKNAGGREQGGCGGGAGALSLLALLPLALRRRRR